MRRNGVRREVSERVTFKHDDGKVLEGWALNVSRGGLRAVTGVMRAVYTASPGQLHLELTADDLAVNNAKLDWSATADIAAAGAARTMTWRATMSGSSAGGRSFERSNDHTIRWTVGEPCFAFSGTSEGEVRRPNGAVKRSLRVEISEFRRCRRGCPDAGGRITVTNTSSNERVELTFDGTNRATFTDVSGKETAIPLLCRP